MENHNHHHHVKKSNFLEYLKFAGVLALILVLSGILEKNSNLPFMEAFMGVFFAVFGLFKLINIKEFAYGFQSYDIIASKV